MKTASITLLCGLLANPMMTASALAQPEGFKYGPVIKDEGPIASIKDWQAIPENTFLRVSMDVVDRAEKGKKNRSLITAARFLNMHADAGLPHDHVKLALVIHGSAVHDVTNDDFFSARNDGPNANTALIKALIANGVEIHVCGQSAAFNGITAENLAPGVVMSLSAITAHALLQQDGYTLNPF